MPKTPEQEFSTSNLLFDESPLLLRPQLAVRIGDREAILLQQIHYWLENKRKSTKVKDYEDERTYNEGRFWTYNTYKDWQSEQFPFWSVRTVERLFTKLEDMGILISGNFNKLKMDRTKWYTIDYDALDTYVGAKGKKVKKNKVEEVKEENKDGEVNKAEESEQSEEVENVDLEQSAKMAECIEPHYDKVAECTTTQSAKLAECNPPEWQDATCQSGSMQSATLGSAIPKSTSETSTETSSQDFLSSSSIDRENNIDSESSEVVKEEEEFQIKRALGYLGFELAQSKIMRTNKQIDETLKMILERELYPFDNIDVEQAITHYKDECAKRGRIGMPPLFFTNGMELKLNQRYSLTIGNDVKKQKNKGKKASVVNDVPFYNWLGE